LIHRTDSWLVEHCIGPLGPGTLVVKPERHVTAVADLSPAEAAELGPLLRRTSWVASQLVAAEQIYNCLWSHADGAPGHIHYVVQPVTRQQMVAYDCYGPGLQIAMFGAGIKPDPGEVDALADQARQLFALNR
jgi:diadenosine tetraphosphate (Ap4A) HIT family hydrolase